MLDRVDKELAGFTLMEVIVGMTMTVILLLMCLNGLRLFQGLYQLVSDTQNEVYEVSTFKQQIRSEFKSSEYALVEDDKLTLELTQGIYSYQFEEDKIIKERLVGQGVFVDTLPIIVESVSYYFENKEVFFDLIDKVVIDCRSKNTQNNLMINKEYSALVLMNYFK